MKIKPNRSNYIRSDLDLKNKTNNDKKQQTTNQNNRERKTMGAMQFDKKMANMRE